MNAENNQSNGITTISPYDAFTRMRVNIYNEIFSPNLLKHDSQVVDFFIKAIYK